MHDITSFIHFPWFLLTKRGLGHSSPKAVENFSASVLSTGKNLSSFRVSKYQKRRQTNFRMRTLDLFCVEKSELNIHNGILDWLGEAGKFIQKDQRNFLMRILMEWETASPKRMWMVFKRFLTFSNIRQSFLDPLQEKILEFTIKCTHNERSCRTFFGVINSHRAS